MKEYRAHSPEVITAFVESMGKSDGLLPQVGVGTSGQVLVKFPHGLVSDHGFALQFAHRLHTNNYLMEKHGDFDCLPASRYVEPHLARCQELPYKGGAFARRVLALDGIHVPVFSSQSKQIEAFYNDEISLTCVSELKSLIEGLHREKDERIVTIQQNRRPQPGVIVLRKQEVLRSPVVEGLRKFLTQYDYELAWERGQTTLIREVDDTAIAAKSVVTSRNTDYKGLLFEGMAYRYSVANNLPVFSGWRGPFTRQVDGEIRSQSSRLFHAPLRPLPKLSHKAGAKMVFPVP